MSDKVWVLHQPEYDCDIIHGVFTGRELAYQAKAALLKQEKWLGLQIDEYDLNTYCCQVQYTSGQGPRTDSHTESGAQTQI